MADKSVELLQQAILRNSGAVISLPSAGMLRNYRSRFLAEMEGGILLQFSGDEAPLIRELIRDQTPCAVSFRGGIYNVVFAAPIRRVETSWRMNESLTADALLLDFPTKIKSTQKRGHYRVQIPPGTDIFVRVWRLGDHERIQDEPVAAKEVKAEIRNLSTGGFGARLIGKDGAPPIISSDDRLRIELKYYEKTLFIEGWMRPPAAAPRTDTIVTGIQFRKLQNDLEGRQMIAQITRIVGEMQRAEVRQMRLGMMKSA